MIDIKLIIEQPEMVDANNKKRGFDLDISVAQKLYSKRSDLIGEVQVLREKANDIAQKMPNASDNEKEGLKEEGKKLKEEVKEKEADLTKIEADLEEELWKYPNILAEDVPEGKDESENQVVREWGTPADLGFEPKDHVTLGEDHDLIDLTRAAEISGSRFYYLKNEAALIEAALIQLVFSTLSDPAKVKEIAQSVSPDLNPKPFIPTFVPMMINADVMRRMGRLSEADKDERYHLEKDDKYLVGSAEHSLGPMHMGESFKEEDLPLRYVGFSTSFRREAGSYGKDTRGILRVHQFDKLEMETFSTPEISRMEQDLMVAIQEYFLQQLEIPYQVMMICTGDMGTPDARQIDLNAWIPSQGVYRETHTSDLMTDFQSRRLNTKVKLDTGEKAFVHMNDATALAIPRTLIAILENNQQQDGTIKIPTVLQKWVGKEKIG